MCFLFKKVFKKYDTHREDVAVFLLEKGDNLLDIGCNEGFLLSKAKGKYTNLYGIDIVSSRLAIARENFERELIENKVVLKTEDINNGLDFEDDFFDAVTIIATLSFIYNPFFVIKEINRILKSGGILVVQVPNIAYIKYRIKLLFGQLPITTSPYDWENVGWDRRSLHYFTISSLRWLLESQSFKIEKVTGSGLFANLRNWYPSLLCGDIYIKARKIK